jgi:LPXTG-motif cell wall-anchored protein
VQAQSTSTFTLQPGGTATVTFEAFCTEFGQVFAAGVELPSGLAPDAGRAALAYGVSQGYNTDGAQALELQFALWQALGTTTSPKGGTVAQDVLTNGKAVPANPQGTSVLDAVTGGDVTVKLDSWAPIGPKVQITATASDNFYGRGQLTIQNTSQRALTLYMPVGTLFPSTNPAQQTMAGYATDVQVTNPTLPATGGDNANGLLALVVALIGSGLLLRRVR